MAMELATQLRPEPFKFKQKGDSEQLMQDFIQYRDRMEMFFCCFQEYFAVNKTQTLQIKLTGFMNLQIQDVPQEYLSVHHVI